MTGSAARSAATAAALLAVAICSKPAAAADVRHDRAARDTDRLGWVVPDFGKVQTGGYSGLITVGLGYAAFRDVLNLTVDYGYVPAAAAGRNVHSVSTSVSVRPIDVRLGDFRLVPGYLGGGLLFTFGDGYFITAPDRYQKYSANYYPPTGVHWMAHVGIELDWLPHEDNLFERHGLYWEVRTLDTFLFSYVENPRTLSPLDAVASAIGYRAAW